MSRAGLAPQRNLSLTEELEKLEQSITLTLQEIDHNFSKAHRIVTTSILPIVEQYSEHSKAVWEGSKFWKQFFEASANVSLSGYEEAAMDEDDEDTALSQSYEHESIYGASQSHAGDSTVLTDTEGRHVHDQDEESLLEDADISGSTPRPPKMKSGTNGMPSFAQYPSPYETLKRELKGGDAEPEMEENVGQLGPTTPGRQQTIPDMSMTPLSSPFEPASYLPSNTHQSSRKAADPLLHRILDKNYRLQATPHTARKERPPPAKPSWRDQSSPMSSPPSMAPQLRSELFSSPMRQQLTKAAPPRTPGVSVQTPAKNKSRDIWNQKDEVSWESDSEDAEDIYKELGMSPPKTIQFAVAPSRLLQTPAREASKRIVEDLLMTAGAGQDTDPEDSLTVLRLSSNVDDSF